MEKSLFIENLSQLKNFSPKGFQRIYFGSETCERRLPSSEELGEAKQFCNKNSLSFSLVTPFCTDSGMNRLEQLLPLLSQEDEVIANDFGVLALAKQHNLKPVAGRLLNRQFRDPRISCFKGFPDEMLKHLSMSQACSPEFRGLLSSLGVKRVELDNLLQGIGTDLSGTGMSASLYHPIVFVSATRLCLLSNAGKTSQSRRVGIFPCAGECKKFMFSLDNSAFPARLLLVGNALFFENSKLPNEGALAKRGIDRLVINRALSQL